MAITQKLRPYQVEIGRAVFDSIYNRKGLTFTVEIARQGGKNELSAQIELLLLTLYMKKGGNAIKCSPTFKPQAMTSILRLEERLAAAGYFTLWSREHGNMVRVGKARQIFLSADGSSHVVGATAQLLLEVDECQDVSELKFDKAFRPMAASTNATTVLWGTTWDDNTLLEKTKKVNQEMEKMDGIKRHFRFDWEHVARYNP
ncbi:MAG: hypothetical protein NTV30_07695, partial [Chloroflexi bacterium]|nr:hypothetical protein [Chloroflexota bacterium]